MDYKNAKELIKQSDCPRWRNRNEAVQLERLFLCLKTLLLKLLLFWIFVLMRGQQSLFDNVFPSSVASNPDNQGRRNTLIDKRDECLVYRYYFHAEIKRKRYDDCLADLEKEFFITAGVITQRITLNLDLLKKVTDKKANLLSLKRKFPHWNWN